MAKSQKSKNQKIFSEGNIIFDFVSCDCARGSKPLCTKPLSKGAEKYALYMEPNGNRLSYVYKNGKELINGADKRAVLPDLLAIRDGNVDDLIIFIERHGFLLPLAPNTDNSVEADLLFVFINRLKATVSLVSALGAVKLDYKKIIALTLYLLLTPQTSIKLPNGYDAFYTCNHELGYFWNNINSINERNLRTEDIEVHEGLYIDDTTCNPSTFVEKGDYYDAIDFGEYDLSTVKKRSTFLFVNATETSYHCRQAIDFLYHFTNDIGDIQKWNHKGELTVTMNGQSASAKFEKNEQLQQVLITVAKNTLKTEIEYNLSGIVPSYDAESLAPAWRVEYLLAGLYYSLFNMRAKEEEYRLCAKPDCGRYFYAQKSSVKQKYCSNKCANVNAQRVYRKNLEKPK